MPFKRTGPLYVGVIGKEAPQLDVRIAYPAPAGIDGQEGARRILATMLNNRVGDIRFKLGSTYGVYAGRTPRRGPTSYQIGGTVDSERGGESIKAMREFVTLERAARLYDRVFTCWEKATGLLPVNVHRIRYERMVEDLEGEMRALLDFLGLPWDDKVLDNRGAAKKREHIRTASYSQVGEAIYTRSAGRWEQYREQMAGVLPILAPWAEKMGYAV